MLRQVVKRGGKPFRRGIPTTGGVGSSHGALGLDLDRCEGWRGERFKMDELHRIASALRVERVMQPYLEAIVL